jgi:hypothetical protein
MAYFAKDDILIYLEQTVGIGQGLSTNVKLTFFKDFIGQHLDVRNSGSLRISLFNAAGKRLLTFRYPDDLTAYGGEPIAVSTNPATRGEIEFTISQFYSSRLDVGAIYAEVVFVDTVNYYPTTKTYAFDQFALGTVAATGIPLLQEAVAGDSLVSTFNISSITGANPTASGTASINSSAPQSVTTIKFNNLNENSIRLSSLENFLTNRLAKCEGIITLINTLAPTQYAVYKIISWSRINLNGSTDSEFGDAIQITLEFEAAASSQIYAALTWAIGSRISYQLEAFADVADIETSLSHVLLSIDSLETTIGGTTLSSSVDSLESQLSSLSHVLSSIDSLETTIGGTTLSSSIDSLESQLSSQLLAIFASIDNIESISHPVSFTERNRIPITTSGNNASTGITLSRQPTTATFIEINVNGSIIDVKDGTGTNQSCYFSVDGGLTPKTYAQLSIGDTLYWNGILAGYDLDGYDRIDMTYQVES